MSCLTGDPKGPPDLGPGVAFVLRLADGFDEVVGLFGHPVQELIDVAVFAEIGRC